MRRTTRFWIFAGMVVCMLLLAACDLPAWFGATAPTLTPTIMPTPASYFTREPSLILLTASAQQVHVGETVIIHFETQNLGMPAYSIRMTPGGQFYFLYSNTDITMIATPIPNEALVFDFVNPAEPFQGGGLALRAVAPGTMTLDVSATGEVAQWQIVNGTPMPIFTWGGASASITLTAVE